MAEKEKLWAYDEQVLDRDCILEPYEDVFKRVAEAVAADREGKVRRALMELGWTPPEESK